MPLVVIPQILLCGLFLPRDAMPPALEAISDVLPLSYAVDAMTAVATDDRRRPSAASTRRSGRTSRWCSAFAVAGLALGAATLRRRTP